MDNKYILIPIFSSFLLDFCSLCCTSKLIEKKVFKGRSKTSNMNHSKSIKILEHPLKIHPLRRNSQYVILITHRKNLRLENTNFL